MFLTKFKKQLEQRLNREEIYSRSDYWDEKALQLKGHSVSMWKNNHLNDHYHKEQIEIITNAFPDLRGKALLDLGCGTGRMSRWLARRGAKVTGIDFSKEALAIAKSKTFTENPHYRVLSMFDLSETSSFDIIFSWGSVAIASRNKQDLVKALRVMHQALKQGGEVLLLEPIHRGFLHRVLDMNVSEFLSVMRSVGFEICDVTPVHFWPARIALAYVSWPRIITTPIYHLGQLMMRLPGFDKLGDYHAIYATRK